MHSHKITNWVSLNGVIVSSHDLNTRTKKILDKAVVGLHHGGSGGGGQLKGLDDGIYAIAVGTNWRGTGLSGARWKSMGFL